jgi:predicted acylesterase/phospholipase RssA
MSADVILPPLYTEAQNSVRRSRLILSLSGGGYRGLFTAHVFEQLLRRFGAGAPLIHQVDMFAGTSIGGIIACALSRGCTPACVKKLLRDRDGRIFPKKRLRSLKQTLHRKSRRWLRSRLTAALVNAAASH